MASKKIILKKFGKVLLYLFVLLIVVISGVVVYINTDHGKNFIKGKLEAYLQNKLQTKLSIKQIDFSLPKWVKLEGIYLQDQHNDTLLYGGSVAVDIDMLQLVSGNIYIRKVALNNIVAGISRPENDSTFNYQFIINAFASKTSETALPVDTTLLKIKLDQLLLNNIRVKFSDKYGGNEMSASVKNMDVTMDQFQPDRMQFAINKFLGSGIQFAMITSRESIAATDNKAVDLFLKSNQIDLNEVTVNYQNKVNGMLYDNFIQHLEVNKMDLNLAKETVSLNSVVLDSSIIHFTAAWQPGLKVSKDSTAVASNWKVTLDNLNLKEDALVYNDNNTAPKEGLDFSHLDLKKINIGVKKIAYAADSINANINQLAFADKSGFKIDSTHAYIRYNALGVAISELYLKTPQSLLKNKLALHYDDIKKITANPLSTTVDVQLNKSLVAINDLYMLIPTIKKYLPENKFRNSTLSLSTNINGSLQKLNIPLLQLAGLDGSIVNAKAILYNITDTNNLAYDITIFNSTLPKSDLLKFLPADNPLMNNLPPVFNLGTHLKGNLKNSTADINISSSTFSLSGSGEIKNIDNPKKLQYNIAIANSRVQKSFIEALVPAGTIPESISLPDVIFLSGTAKGDVNNIQPNLKLNGSYGIARVSGFVKNFKDKEAAVYDINFTTDQFQLGKLLKQDTVLGILSFTGTAVGKGFNYKTMSAVINGHVKSVDYNKYRYQDIDLNARLKKGLVESEGKINDPNIQMNYTATATVSGEYPTVEASIRVDTVQLQPLHFYKDTVNASFTTYMNIVNLDPKNIEGFIRIDSSKLNVLNRQYLLDSIVAKAATSNGIHTITLTSPLADIAANGAFEYDKITPALISYISRYYALTDSVIVATTPQQINFEGVLKRNSIVPGLVEGLDYNDIPFKGSFSSNKSDSALQLVASMPFLRYQTNRLGNGSISINTLNDQLAGDLRFDTAYLSNNILYKTTLLASVAGDSLSITAATKDKNNTDRFALGADISQKNKAYTFSLKDTLLLDYKKWNVSVDNKIFYSPEGILVNNFQIKNDSSSIAIASRENVLNAPIDVNIVNFKIKDITSMLISDTLLATGSINGKFSVSEFDKKLPAFTGNVGVDSLQFMQQPIGNIQLFTEKAGENTITATVGLTGNGNNVAAKGNYYLDNDARQFDATVDIKNLNMTTLQAFSKGNLVQSSGAINGNIELAGTFAEPHWNGSVNFDTTRFSLASFGTSYALNQQKIVFNYPNITFNDFTIKDSANNTLKIDGDIISKSMTDYDLNLDIEAKNFTLVNATNAIANQVSGYAAVDANITVTGHTAAPVIEGNVKLNDKTDLKLILPESNINKDAAISVVRFIDRDTFALPEAITFSPAKEVKPSFAQFLNYNLNIEVSKKAAVTIVIDPSTGDELKIQGDANLNAGVDPGGNIVLAGSYELNSGYYILHFEFLKRQFNLLPGSTISFSGAPTDAQINITAEYIAKTSAKELLGNEVGSVDPALSNSFKQEIPFRVLLMLKGSMLKPDISFDIAMPDENTRISDDLRTTIENKLTQLRGDVAGTNKQVFSLLLFNRFVGEQSSDFFKSNGSGDGFGDLARQSVSKFLSAALDNIASDLVKGLDIDLNVNSYKDYSSGDAQQKTDLNIAVTKSFINDRLSISLGKNFGIEGQDAGAKSGPQNGSAILPDITINYKLTQDGKYLLRAYRKTQYEVILDGLVIESGLAFVVTMDFDKFKELFGKKKKESFK